MIGAFVTIGFRELLRRKAELLLTFVLPVAFFSIFALIFGGRGGGTAEIDVAVVDLDDSPTSRRIVELMREEGALELEAGPVLADGTRLDVARAEELVRDGDVALAIVLEPGFEERVPSFLGAEGDAVRLLRDPADPIASNVVAGLLQKLVMGGMPERMAERGLASFDTFLGDLTPEQSARRDEILGWIRQGHVRPPAPGAETPASGAPAAADGFDGSPVRVAVVDVVGEGKAGGMVSYYAAAIAVMFLLFSATGAGGTLIDEEQNGTLERLLATRVTMTTLLVGKGVFLALMGILQIVVMFLWAKLVFGLELFDRLPGFLVMTVATATAAAAFGLLLATLCRSRAQLAGISTIVILAMSALGGSMFPRFLMSETMQTVGLATFNAWALEGYLKVFWRDETVIDVLPQVLVLLLITVAFGLLARLFARRWETI